MRRHEQTFIQENSLCFNIAWCTVYPSTVFTCFYLFWVTEVCWSQSQQCGAAQSWGGHKSYKNPIKECITFKAATAELWPFVQPDVKSDIISGQKMLFTDIEERKTRLELVSATHILYFYLLRGHRPDSRSCGSCCCLNSKAVKRVTGNASQVSVYWYWQTFTLHIFTLTVFLQEMLFNYWCYAVKPQYQHPDVGRRRLCFSRSRGANKWLKVLVMNAGTLKHLKAN